MVQGSNPVMVFCFGNFKPKSLVTKFEVMLESIRTCGSMPSPHIVVPLYHFESVRKQVPISTEDIIEMEY